MGNCLVTKLKSVVDNDALLTLNEFVFDITVSSDYQYGKFRYQNEAYGNYATVIGDGKIGLSANDITHDTITLNSSVVTTIYCSVGTYKIKLPNKQYVRICAALADNNGRYALSAVDAKEIKYSGDWLFEAYIKGNIEDLSGCSKISTLETLDGQVYGNLAALTMDHNIGYFSITSTSVVGTTEKIASLVRYAENYEIAPHVIIRNCPNITGDISYLGALGLHELGLYGTGVTGTLESYISQLPFDGTYTVGARGTITYQGNIIPDNATIVITNGVPTVTIN